MKVGEQRKLRPSFWLCQKIRSGSLSSIESVQPFQVVLDEAKVLLDLAVCRGAWLLPSKMVLNTVRTVAYDNQLKQATQNIKFGVNSDVNKETKKSSLRLMDGDKSKINPPKSHPSNPIHKKTFGLKNTKGN